MERIFNWGYHKWAGNVTQRTTMNSSLQDSLMSVSSMLKQAEAEERGQYEGLTKKIVAALNDLSESFVEQNDNSLAALAGLKT